MAEKNYFTSALFGFLRELADNNEREWFQANKNRYERDVRDPVLRFIADFGPLLEKISPHFLAEPRPVGGSLFRIHRDTRFSKDKTPYKTNVGVQFRHERGKDAHAPGFYLGLEPSGDVYCGAGIWHPDTATAGKIRDAIVNETPAWDAALSGKGFTGRFTMGGESLKRPPRGYDPDHPRVEDLKRKDYFGLARFDEKEAGGGKFMNQYAETCRAASPLVRFLATAAGLNF